MKWTGCLVLGVALIFWSLTGCKAPMPAIDVEFWAGDASQAGVTRRQEDHTLACADPEFDQYVCLTYKDIQKIFDTLLQCEEWPSPGELAKINLIKKNPEVDNYVRAQQRKRISASRH